MRRATPIVAVMALLGLASCGSGDDDDAASASSSTGASTTSSASVSTVATATAAGEVVTTPAPPPPPPPPPSETTAPAEVGAVLLGTAVATVSGGDDPLQQTGDVERVDQQCRGVGTLVGLAEGSPVTVRDVVTGQPIGAGVVAATSAVRIEDSADGRARWDCSFPFRVELTAPATEVAVQIAGLDELFGTAQDGNLTLVVRNDVTSPKPTLPDGSAPEATPASAPELSLPD